MGVYISKQVCVRLVSVLSLPAARTTASVKLNKLSKKKKTQAKTDNSNENTTHETYRFRSRFERRLMSESSWGSSRPGHAVIHEKFCG